MYRRRKRKYTPQQTVEYARKRLFEAIAAKDVLPREISSLRDQIRNVGIELAAAQKLLQQPRPFWEQWWGEGRVLRAKVAAIEVRIRQLEYSLRMAEDALESNGEAIAKYEKMVEDSTAVLARDARRQERKHKERALIARATEKDRSLATTLRRQLKMNPDCPYCGEVIKPADAHLDHIYPVAQGGLSTPSNLVFVCSACNTRKSDLTLNAFVEAASLPRDRVFNRLKQLNKKF